jgi:hypothetical protein
VRRRRCTRKDGSEWATTAVVGFRRRGPKPIHAAASVAVPAVDSLLLWKSKGPIARLLAYFSNESKATANANAPFVSRRRGPPPSRFSRVPTDRRLGSVVPRANLSRQCQKGRRSPAHSPVLYLFGSSFSPSNRWDRAREEGRWMVNDAGNAARSSDERPAAAPWIFWERGGAGPARGTDKNHTTLLQIVTQTLRHSPVPVRAPGHVNLRVGPPAGEMDLSFSLSLSLSCFLSNAVVPSSWGVNDSFGLERRRSRGRRRVAGPPVRHLWGLSQCSIRTRCQDGRQFHSPEPPPGLIVQGGSCHFKERERWFWPRRRCCC